MQDLLTVNEVAERLKVSTKTVYRAVEAGELRASRIGRAWRISEPDVVAYVEARVHPGSLRYFTVALEECEEGGYHVWVPSLPGCHSEGDTREEALEYIREALELHLEPVPEEELDPSVETARVAI
jgi:excisionase family DNA binding protein